MSKFKTEEYRKANAERKKKEYHTDQGNAYEAERRKSFGVRYAKARYKAPRRESGPKEFTLTLEEFIALVTQPCYYCNTTLADEKGCSLDRIDNEGGYTPGNVNPCCKSCNRRRSKSMDAEEFKRQTKLNGRWKD